MKLSQLAAKPQLIKICLDDNATIEQYGEVIEFWTWDRQPLDTFMKLANTDANNVGSMIGIIRGLILDENGAEILRDEAMLPTPVLIAVIGRIVETLGK